MSENTEVTNNRLTIKKSSAQILDEIFRELKEKSEKGTLLTDSDLSTVLGSTIVNEKSAITKKKEKKKKAKHKHSHKHKKRKKRKEKHPSTSSIEEWVPAETIKMNEYIANDVFESMNKNSCAHFGDSIQEPTESHNHHIKTNCEEDTTAILNFPVPINHKTECNLQNVGVDICNEFQLSSTALICSNTNISTKSHDSMESTLIQNKLKSTVLKHMASDDVGLKQSPKRLKTSTNHCIFDKMIEDVNHKVGIPTDIAITSKGIS